MTVYRLLAAGRFQYDEHGHVIRGEDGRPIYEPVTMWNATDADFRGNRFYYTLSAAKAAAKRWYDDIPGGKPNIVECQVLMMRQCPS